MIFKKLTLLLFVTIMCLHASAQYEVDNIFQGKYTISLNYKFQDKHRAGISFNYLLFGAKVFTNLNARFEVPLDDIGEFEEFKISAGTSIFKPSLTSNFSLGVGAEFWLNKSPDNNFGIQTSSKGAIGFSASIQPGWSKTRTTLTPNFAIDQVITDLGEVDNSELTSTILRVGGRFSHFPVNNFGFDFGIDYMIQPSKEEQEEEEERESHLNIPVNLHLSF